MAVGARGLLAAGALLTLLVAAAALVLLVAAEAADDAAQAYAWEADGVIQAPRVVPALTRSSVSRDTSCGTSNNCPSAP